MKRILAVVLSLLAVPAMAADPSQQCFNHLDAYVQLLPLRQLIALGSIENQTIDMMTNSRHPSAQEKTLIKAWVRERDQCYVLGENWRLEHLPANMRSVLDHYYAKNKLLIADLYLANITYGEFAIKRAALSTELSDGLNQAWREHEAGNSVDPAQEARRERERADSRAAMLAAATRIFERGQPLPAASAVGANCTSEWSGPYLYTICR